MTNEERVSQLVSGYGSCCKDECYHIAIRMAEWKDAQFKEHLVKKRIEKSLGNPIEEYGMGFKDGIDYILDEIINELFGE